MIDIVFDQKQHKSIAYDDSKKIGECNFIEIGNTWNIIHTEVDILYQGKGIAKRLVNMIIENAKLHNKSISADCSYAKKIIRH